jgi:hypothetical protein
VLKELKVQKVTLEHKAQPELKVQKAIQVLKAL